MCGIVYSKDFTGKKVNKQIRTQYFNQKNRGTDGYGFVIVKDKVDMVRAHYEHEIMHELRNHIGSEIIFHHRIPTSTPNRIVSNHPIPSDGNELYVNKYYLVHNGIIWNCDQLKYRHEDLTIQYSTQENGKFNDSESLLHELALYIEGYQDKISCTGSLAFILLQTTQDGKPLNLYFGRNNGNPLRMIYERGKRLLLSSEGKGEMVPTDLLYKYNYEDDVLTYSDVSLGSDGYSSYQSVDDDIPMGYMPVTDAELDTMGEDKVEELYQQIQEYRQSILVDYSNAIASGSKDEEDDDYKEELDEELEHADKLITRIEERFPHLMLNWIT